MKMKATAERLDQSDKRLLGLEVQVNLAVNAMESQGTSPTAAQVTTGLPSRIAAVQKAAALLRDYAEEIHFMKRDQGVLESLMFECLWSREDGIEDAYVTTLNWIFDDRVTNFRSWLETGNGVYWINGLVSTILSTVH